MCIQSLTGEHSSTSNKTKIVIIIKRSIFFIMRRACRAMEGLCNNIAGALSRRKAETQEHSVTRWRFNNKTSVRAQARLLCHNLRQRKRGSYNIKVRPILSQSQPGIYEGRIKCFPPTQYARGISKPNNHRSFWICLTKN